MGLVCSVFAGYIFNSLHILLYYDVTCIARGEFVVVGWVGVG